MKNLHVYEDFNEINETLLADLVCGRYNSNFIICCFFDSVFSHFGGYFLLVQLSSLFIWMMLSAASSNWSWIWNMLNLHPIYFYSISINDKRGYNGYWVKVAQMSRIQNF